MNRVSPVWSNEGVLVHDVYDCLLCGREGMFLYKGLRDRLFGAPGVWSLMECKDCGLCWLNPRPLPSEIPKLYATYYTHAVGYIRPRWKTLIITSVLAASYGYPAGGKSRLFGFWLSMLGPIRERVGASVLFLHAKDKGRLLDVGCGNGQFLAWMNGLGWQGIGLDPDSNAVRIAKDRFGVTAFEGTIENACFSANFFDTLTMNHVIEHISDPVKALIECFRVLRPGGKLVIVTPNAESLASRLMGSTWLHWDPPRHLVVFSPRALHRLVIRCGFTVRELYTLARGAGDTWVKSRLLRRHGVLPAGSSLKGASLLKLEALLFWLAEYALSRRLGLGEELLMVATKRGE
jgi:SAM-dependent methyltransferase